MQLKLHHLFTALAQVVVDEGVLPLLVLCIQEAEVPLKRIAASCLGNIEHRQAHRRAGAERVGGALASTLRHSA